MAIVEPYTAYPEADFQDALLAVISDLLKTAGCNFHVLERFGLDIAVFLANSNRNVVRFFEVKSFGGQRMGGVGFGNQKGHGAQVDILLMPDSSSPLIDESVCWIYVDATQPAGNARYALFTCATAKAAAMGGVARGKQNNLRTSALQNHLVTWIKLCDEIKCFLLT